MGAFEILSGLAILAYLIYYFTYSSFGYWKSRGVNGPKPLPIVGNFLDAMLIKSSLGDVVKKIYDEYPNERLIGIYNRMSPVLVVKDLDLIKDVLIKDFSKFMHRGIAMYEKAEPLSENMFNLEPERWRPLRIKLSPVFTSGKLKEMFHLIQECTDNFNDYLTTLVARNEPIDVRDISAKYTTEVISSCGFGLKTGSLSDETSVFRKMGKKTFDTTLKRMIKVRIRDTFPNFYRFISPLFYDKELTDFFINSIRETISYREKNNIVRHDFVNLLMEMKNNAIKVGDTAIEMTDLFLTCQAFIFFSAGFETSSNTMTHILYELALNHIIQDKLRTEIKDEIKACEGKLKYESLKSMKYLNKILQEALRKYPVLPTLLRKSTEPYTFAGTNVTIPAGQQIWLPIYSIQHDPKYYPNPELFDPERFSEEAKQTRHPMCFLSFGDGPRNCIGERFAKYQTLLPIVKIIDNYRVDVCEKTMNPYVKDPGAFAVTPKDGLFLKFTKLNNDS